MFTKTILATAAAALLSAGAIGLSISAANAGGYQDGYYITKEISLPKTICKTFYKTVSSYDDYYNLVYKQVPFEKCETIYVKSYEKVFVPYAHDDYQAPSYSSSY
jgi:hypothetical protein